MINPKKYAVYYRDIPLALQHLINQDGHMGVCKDGVFKFNDLSCPRLTITVEPVARLDVERLRRLEQLLAELAANNQIAGWTG